MQKIPTVRKETKIDKDALYHLELHNQTSLIDNIYDGAKSNVIE